MAEKNKKEESFQEKKDINPDKYITIELEGQELRFDRDSAFRQYDTFINTAGSGKLAKASNNYCVSIIHKEDLVAFRELKARNPSIALLLAGEISESVAPEVEITVKKR